MYKVRKYPNCWFLENNGLCYIQTKYGCSYKPFICRFHPFCIIRCNNEYVVVLDKCPTLHVDKESKNSAHKQILKNAQEAIDGDVIAEEINWPRWRMNLEKKILEGSKMFLGSSNYLDFSAYQISITTGDVDMAKIKSKLLNSVKLWKSFLKINELDMKNKRITYELILLTSLFRIGNSYLRQIEVEKVPLALLAIYFYAVLFSKNENTKVYFDTYKVILQDISLGLLYLKKDELSISGRSIENRLRHLRLLQKAHIQKLMSNVEEKEILNKVRWT